MLGKVLSLECSYGQLKSLCAGSFIMHFCGLLSRLTFSKKTIRDTIRMSISSDPDQALHIVGPDLNLN